MTIQPWLTGWRRLPVAFALGAPAALGQEPWALGVCTILGLGLLVWLVSRAETVGTAFWIGLAAGTGYFAVALSWIVEPFLIDIARHGWMAPFAVLFLSVGLGLFWAAAAALSLAFPVRPLGFVA
jgi:apolipoprotein N-acyltransferase